MKYLTRTNSFSKKLFAITIALLLVMELISFTSMNFAQRVWAQGNSVEIWRNNQIVATYSSIQEAVDHAVEGDLVRVREGTYYEAIKITKTISLEGAEGEEVIIDGADPEFQKPNNGKWTHLGDGIYSANIPFPDPIPQVTYVSYNSDDKMIFPYANEEQFESFHNGEGSLREQDTIKVKLKDNIDPNTVGLNIARYPFIIESAVNFSIKNITIKNAGRIGIQLAGNAYDDILIDNVEIVNCHRGVNASTEGGSGIKILNCNIYNGWARDWAWRLGYNTGESSDARVPMRGHGIYIYRGNNSKIAYNEIHGMWDGGHIGGENITIHDNKIYHINDDAMELESGYSKNLHFYNNIIWDSFVGISMIPNTPGPLYVYRNIVVINKYIRREPENGLTTRGYCLKFGVGRTFINAKIYNNSFYSTGRIIFDKNEAEWQGIEFVNNIMYSTYEGGIDDEILLSKTGTNMIGRPNDAVWDRSLWARTAVRDDDTAKRNDVNGVVGNPMYKDPLASPPDMTVPEDSPVVNKGLNVVEVKGWPDSIRPSDGQYDIGAIELGGIPVEPDTTPPIEVILDGNILNFDQTPIIISGRTMVPLRGIFEALGANIEWDAETSTIRATREGSVIVMKVGDNKAVVDGKEIILDQAAQIVNGRTLVPVRFIGEASGAEVTWDEAKRQVVITTGSLPNPGLSMLKTTGGVVTDSSKAKLLFPAGAEGYNTGIVSVEPPEGESWSKAVYMDVASEDHAEATDIMYRIKLDPRDDVSPKSRDWIYVSYYVRALKPKKDYADAAKYGLLMRKEGAKTITVDIAEYGEEVPVSAGWQKKEFAVKLNKTFGTKNQLEFFVGNPGNKQYLQFADLKVVYFGDLSGADDGIRLSIQKYMENWLEEENGSSWGGSGLENDEKGFTATGIWKLSTLPAANPDHKTYYTNDVNVYAMWKPDIREACDVKISVFKLVHGTSQLQKYEIHYDGKVEEKEIDFRSGQAEWVELGTFNFAGNGDDYVKLICDGGPNRVAEVRFDIISGTNTGKL